MALLYILIAVLIVLIFVCKRRPQKFLDVHSMIGVHSPCLPVIGHIYKYFGNNEDRMKAFDTVARETYDSKHKLVSFWALDMFVVVVTDPESASIVLRTCMDKWPLTKFARHLIGNGSVFGQEEISRVRRKILNPIFATKYYNNFMPVFQRRSRTLMDQLAAAAGSGDLSMWQYFSSYSLDSALEMTFGENVNRQKHVNVAFLEALQDYSKVGALVVCQPWLCGSLLYRLTGRPARMRRNRAVMWNCVETLLMELSGGKAGYSHTELREETLVLLLAATDTSATAACFAAVLLANHPHVQDSVYEEVQEVLGYSDRSVCIDDIPKLKYLDAVVKEALRLYPPAPLTLRRCNKDVRLRITLPQGCEVLLHFWGLHRNPHYWGADADEFRPERFLSATPHQLAAFMPFGHGPRNCAGSRLALASLKLSLGELTRRFRLLPAAGYRCSVHQPLRVSFELMLKHVHDFKLQLEHRC